jgi:hypothetical protein
LLRSKGEVVPAVVGWIDIDSRFRGKAPIVSITVTDQAKITQIVGWIDALGILQPGAFLACPALGGPTVTFDFRTAGALLAKRAWSTVRACPARATP